MTTVSAGSAGSYTFATNEQALISPTQGEACEVTVLRAGAVIASQRITTEKAIGPFRAGDVMTLTAQRGAVDYTVSTYAGSHTDTLDSAELTALQALVSGAGNTYVRWCIPGRDTSGTLFKDTSGRGNDATIDASNGTPFAVDSRISAVAHASAGGVTLPLAAASCDLDTDSWVMSFAMTRANPGANESVASFGASGGSSSPGIYFSHRLSAAGVGRLVANRGNAGLVSGSDTTVAFSNAGGTVERHVVMAYDAPTRSIYLYRDGVVAASNVGLITGASEWTVTPLANGARLGGVLASGVTVACAFRGWQGYVFAASGLPLNIGRIAAMLAEAPSQPLRDYEFQFTA